MCSVSAVLDYGISNPPWQYQTVPAMREVSLPLPDREAAEAIKRFMKLVDAAKEFDVATKQPDCEDPEKVKFMTKVLDRLAAIERRLDSLQPTT